HNSSRPPDEGLTRAISQQERWAQDAVAGRPNRAQLDAIRASDYQAVGRGRTEFKRLIQSIDRGTWIRNTTAELMSDDPDPRLPAMFDRAGRLRSDAILGADELASALGEARGGLSIGDLRPGFEALRKAQGSEDRLSRLPPRAGGLRLLPAPIPVPRPFIVPAARLVAANPELPREPDRPPRGDAAPIRPGPRARGAEASGDPRCAGAAAHDQRGATASGRRRRSGSSLAHAQDRQRCRRPAGEAGAAFDHAARGWAVRSGVRRCGLS